eukprot:7323759-Heterocapsa_arctica.AAC.1
MAGEERPWMSRKRTTLRWFAKSTPEGCTFSHSPRRRPSAQGLCFAEWDLNASFGVLSHTAAHRQCLSLLAVWLAGWLAGWLAACLPAS